MLKFDTTMDNICPHCSSKLKPRVIGLSLKGSITKEREDLQHELMARQNQHKDIVLEVCTNCPYSNRNYIKSELKLGTDIKVTKVMDASIKFDF